MAILVLVALAIAILSAVGPVFELATGSQRLPRWDMAKYGVSGLRLANMIEEGDLLAIIGQINALDVWPPVFPLLEAPVFLFFGPDYSSARGLVAVLFVIAVIAAMWAGYQTNSRFGLAIGASTAALVLTSPFTQGFATIVMLEVPGAAFLLLAFGWYARSLEAEDRRAFTLACVFATVLFFCKYNYGLLWIIPVALSEAIRLRGTGSLSPPDAPRRIRQALFRPWSVVVAIGLGVGVLVELTGPWQWSVFGYAVRIASAGRIVYALYLLSVLRWLLRPSAVTAFRERLAQADPRLRTAIRWVGLPIAIWMLVPSHATNFVEFLINRSSGPSILSWRGMTFYPKVFVAQFSPAPWLGVAVLGLALISVRRIRGGDQIARVLALAIAWGTLMLVLHPYKLPRFLFPVAPLLWLGAARETALIAAGLLSHLSEPTRRQVLGALSAVALVVVSTIAPDPHGLEQFHDRHTVPASTRPVVDAIVDAAVDVESSIVVGTWNLLSPWLIEWYLRGRQGGAAASRIPDVAAPRDLDTAFSERLASSAYDLIFVLTAIPESTAVPQAFHNDTAWLDPIRTAIVSDHRFEVVSEQDFVDSGYRLIQVRPR